MSLYALGHACTHRRISDVRRYQHSVEGVSDHLSYNAYYAANPGQTNQHTQGIVRAESGYYCRDPLRFSLWDSIGSTLIQQHTASAVFFGRATKEFFGRATKEFDRPMGWVRTLPTNSIAILWAWVPTPPTNSVAIRQPNSPSLSKCTPADSMWAKNWLHFSICACHPCAGAMLIFSVSFQF